MKEKKTVLDIDRLSVNLKTERGTFTAVNQVSFQIEAGETVALVGESGCGKSLTSLSIMGLIAKKLGKIDGTIRFKDKVLNQLHEREMRAIRGCDISMIFQEPMTSLNPVHSIGRQIDEVFRLHTDATKQERRNHTIDMLRKVGIPRAEKIVKDFPHQLSGGMKQRVMIAMAMACQPDLLIADEPTTALDVTIQAQILDLMNDLKQKVNTAILLITHDLGVVAEMADRVMVMYYGEIVEEADVQTLFASPKHPYTVGLLQSIPSLERENKRLTPIEGNVPILGEVHEGCPFLSRCPQAIERCAQEKPPVVRTGKHAVRCWMYADEEVAI
ncbi:ABC transporter ATP-binding protein [Brevibacillus invocatus]|uniref:ABC transporter ATP-binding protein n=1 Tax=Brevibacillus invocatus TaxID=173959 RepID=UPI00203F9EAD|nr:ABC transporter ATP-binding protein [Brevibacillus invocatus]MCM3078316.1 ABC transporter ATP-binding protein [Brevibacillus invocatus]MCM3428529.1 ABC transporter ATP-binding protein [Brevibacillus invocatus]